MTIEQLLKTIDLQEEVVKRHKLKGDMKSAIKMQRKICQSLLDNINSATFTNEEKVTLIKRNKMNALKGFEMMDYMLSLKAAVDNNIALESAVSRKGGNTHEMSEEERMYMLYNKCVVKNFNKTFDEVSGHESAIKRIKQSIIYPHNYPHLMNECHLPNGILMFGPPG